MKIKFLGVGGAFSSIAKGNSNMLITSESGHKMMIDFGITAPFIYRDEMKMDFGDIDAVYLTHLHSDHVGGIEMLAFHRYFLPKRNELNVIVKPKLFMVKSLMKEMWDNTLRGGLESLQGKIMTLTDYFDCKPILENKSFNWEGYNFTPVQTIHVRSGYIIKYSYGLAIRKINDVVNGVTTSKMIRDDVYDAYITGDTQFDLGLMEYYKRAKVIFHDCETGSFRSVVHPNYSDLNTLPTVIKNKMYLYHYHLPVESYKEDGFAGFVEKGQEFII